MALPKNPNLRLLLKNSRDIIRRMDVLESAEIVNLLNSKGFVLQQESSPNHLRFERQSGDEHFEIEILVSPPSLLARLKLGGNPQIYNATTFDELKTLLKDKIE